MGGGCAEKYPKGVLCEIGVHGAHGGSSRYFRDAHGGQDAHAHDGELLMICLSLESDRARLGCCS